MSRKLASTIITWEQLLAGAEANREDLPALEQYRVQLEAEMADIKAAHARRLALQAESRQATRDLVSFLRRGSDLADRLKSGVRLLYGRRGAKLADFGMKVPRKRGKTKPGPGCQVKGCPLEATATAK
jgi:hypothetical protein